MTSFLRTARALLAILLSGPIVCATVVVAPDLFGMGASAVAQPRCDIWVKNETGKPFIVDARLGPRRNPIAQQSETVGRNGEEQVVLGLRSCRQTLFLWIWFDRRSDEYVEILSDPDPSYGRIGHVPVHVVTDARVRAGTRGQARAR